MKGGKGRCMKRQRKKILVFEKKNCFGLTPKHSRISLSHVCGVSSCVCASFVKPFFVLQLPSRVLFKDALRQREFQENSRKRRTLVWSLCAGASYTKKCRPNWPAWKFVRRLIFRVSIAHWHPLKKRDREAQFLLCVHATTPRRPTAGLCGACSAHTKQKLSFPISPLLQNRVCNSLNRADSSNISSFWGTSSSSFGKDFVHF